VPRGTRRRERKRESEREREREREREGGRERLTPPKKGEVTEREFIGL